MNKINASHIAGLLGGIIVLFLFREYFFYPGTKFFEYGGDGLFIYYNMIFHSLYGEGIYLASMNYPTLDNIFMTDAQAMVTILFNKLGIINEHLPYHVIGCANLLTLFSIIGGIYFVARTLELFKVSRLLVIFGACCIVLLSPQMNRIAGGHVGLAYTHLIPLVIFWLANKKPSLGLNIFVFSNILFFGLNNIYLSLLLSSLVIAYLLINYCSRSSNWKEELVKRLWGVIPLLIIFIFIKATDPFHDRVGVPWGFKKHYSTLEGLVLGQDSWVSNLLGIDKVSFPIEGLAYLGLIPILLGLIYIILFIWKKVTGQLSVFSPKISRRLLVLNISALLIIFALSVFFRLIDDRWGGPLELIFQFRTPGRFSWLFYFSFTITAVYILDRLSKSEMLAKPLMYTIIGLGVLFWGIEAGQFCYKIRQSVLADNIFTKEKISQKREVLESIGFEPADYHGIFFLPTTLGWSDKFDQNTFFGTYYSGFQVSVASGLPLINGLLSRYSISELLANKQIASNQLIRKEKLVQLGIEKKVLLIKGIEEKITKAEEYLIQISDTLYADKRYEMFALDIAEYQLSYNTMRNEYLGIVDTLDSEALYFDDFESHSDKRAFTGSGCRSQKKGKLILFQENIESWKLNNELLEVSIWVQVGTERYGMPKFVVKGLDANGTELRRSELMLRHATDVHDGWVLAKVFIESENLKQLMIQLERDDTIYADRLLIRKNSANHSLKDTSNEELLWYNNYPLSLN